MFRRAGTPFRVAVILTAVLLVLGYEATRRAANSTVTNFPLSTSAETFMGVRVLKKENAGTLQWSVELPSGCRPCQLEDNADTRIENGREFYFHLLVPSSLPVVQGMRIKVDPDKVRGVLVGRDHVPFVRTTDGITFDAPRNGPTLSQLADFYTLPGYVPGDVSDMRTYLETPGVETRVEHADEKRRAGPYKTGPWPAVERQAALNLEFAAREAIVALGLDKTVQERGLGTILLMGFDTNFPTVEPHGAHEDNPPHWHMHLSWSRKPVIREVGHFYISPEGLLTTNEVEYIDSSRNHTLGAGQVYRLVSDTGELLYTHTITPEGHFVLGTLQGACRFSPVERGFDSGVVVSCGKGHFTLQVRAEDDLESGRLRVLINNRVVEQYSYDPDNGMLARSEIEHRRY